MGTGEYKTKRVMKDNTQDERAWKGMIGVTQEGQEMRRRPGKGGPALLPT